MRKHNLYKIQGPQCSTRNKNNLGELTSPHTTVKNMAVGQATGFAAIDTAVLQGLQVLPCHAHCRQWN